MENVTVRQTCVSKGSITTWKCGKICGGYGQGVAECGIYGSLWQDVASCGGLWQQCGKNCGMWQRCDKKLQVPAFSMYFVAVLWRKFRMWQKCGRLWRVVAICGRLWHSLFSGGEVFGSPQSAGSLLFVTCENLL